VPDREGLIAALPRERMSTGDLEPTDHELLARSARGDDRAFERFVVRHRDGVFRYARMASGNDADAEDVLQQTFLQVWRNAGSADVTFVRAWLFTIARHALQRQRRRPSGAPNVEESLDALGAAAGFADPSATPERFAIGLEERSAVHAALAALAEPEREVIMLREIQQMTGEEAARVLGLSLDAMKSRLHRARLRFVAEIRRRLPDEGVHR